MARLSTALIALGLAATMFGVLWQLGLIPGSRVVLPVPLARQRPTAVPAALAPTAVPTPRPLVLVTPPPVPTAQSPLLPEKVETPLPAIPTPAPIRLVAADADDRDHPAITGGYAVRLSIPTIKLDTSVEQAGIARDPIDGAPIWETRPFVAVHYGDLTALVGVPGNAVIAGHVVTINEGNVFRNLYQLDLGDEVDVWDQLDREHSYQVAAVKLVAPSDTSVMEPTADETLTLITCGGEFDPKRREFSARLIVTARPV